MKRFSKELMLKRLEEQGMLDQVDDDIIKIMDDLDGQEVTESCWRRQVYDEPVYYCIGKSGEGNYVNENDCR